MEKMVQDPSMAKNPNPEGLKLKGTTHDDMDLAQRMVNPCHSRFTLFGRTHDTLGLPSIFSIYQNKKYTIVFIYKHRNSKFLKSTYYRTRVKDSLNEKNKRERKRD
jgi:hypothetical protein